ncbi:MAG: S-layer homology domain-containing protein [bacterium]|nr:S-layer homology domain-containing protein [bacterium]
MLKSNFKKLVSLLSTAAMLVSLSVPAVFADGTEIKDDTANLLASGDVLMSDNFDNLDEGALIQYEFIPTPEPTPTVAPGQTAEPTATPKPTQGPYTGLDSVDLYVGGGSANNNQTTGIFVKDGVGVDGSKALALVSGARANASNGPRMEFKRPLMDDKYVITFKAYPTSRQDVYLNDSAASNAASKPLNLNKDEWNDIEIFVSRSGSDVGRIVNVNGVTNTDFSGTTGEAPVVWGIQANNAGELYIDNIEVKVSTVLPTPIPTPSPEPIRQLGIGDGNDFEEYTSGMTVITMTSSAQEPADDIAGFLVHIGSRNGGSSNTNCTIGGGKEGNGLVIANGQFYSANRGARAQLITPTVESDVNYKVTFDVKKTNANNDLYFASSTTSNDGTPAGLEADVWSKAEIYMAGGQQIIFVDGRFIKVSATTELPVLWGSNNNDVGNIIIDNYMIEAADDKSVLDAITASLDIANDEKTVYPGNDGVYNFINGFKVADIIIGKNISWEALELSNNEWVPTEDIKITGTNLIINNKNSEKEYKLVATVTDGDLSSTKEFLLKYIETEDVVKTVIDNLELPLSVEAIMFENDVYNVSNNFSLPLSEWVTEIDWEVTDSSSIQIDKDGDVKVFPKNTDPITLTATVSYNGQSMTKTFPISLLKYYRICLHSVEDELSNTVLYPKGNDGEALTSVTLSPDGETVLSYDVAFKTISVDDARLAVSWKSSDVKVLTNDGVISVVDKEAHPVTLTKTVTYTLEGEQIVSSSKDYSIKVQFNPDTMQAGIDEIVKSYAASKNADEESETYKAAYNRAMEILSDRYKTRGDAVYEENFDDIPSSVDDDFTLPVEGYFGSKITWGSSNTAIKINGENAKVTQPSKDTNVQLKATFTSGASTNADAYTATVEVEGTGKSSGGSGGSSGGGSSYRGSLGTSSYTNPITTPVFGVEPTATQAPEADGFTDLGSVSWAEEAINALADKGIVSGRDAVTFAPNDDITRAEFAKIVVGAFNIELGASAELSDIDSSAWYAPYVGACYAAGIITGYDDGEFKPNNLVTRQEMAVMVLRAAQYKNVTIETPNEKVDFTDADKIAAYAAEAVETLQKAGIINGMEDGKFAPADTATRAQAAKILYTFCK